MVSDRPTIWNHSKPLKNIGIRCASPWIIMFSSRAWIACCCFNSFRAHMMEHWLQTCMLITAIIRSAYYLSTCSINTAHATWTLLLVISMVTASPPRCWWHIYISAMMFTKMCPSIVVYCRSFLRAHVSTQHHPEKVSEARKINALENSFIAASSRDFNLAEFNKSV